jgi:DNA-binding transcriptional LysR family regulator
MKWASSPLKQLSLFEVELFSRLTHYRSLREFARDHELEPSRVSKTLAKIESAVGQPLFRRTAKGITLTPEGHRFYKQTLKISPLFDDLTSSTKTEKQKKTQLITVASVSFLNAHVFPHCIPGLVQSFDHLRFRMIDLSHERMQEEAFRGTIDVAIHFSPLSFPKGWQSQKTGELKSGIFVKANHPLLPQCRAEEALSYPFVVPTYLSKNGFMYGTDQCPVPFEERLISHETSTAETAINVVVNSPSLTYLPRVVARKSLALGEISELPVIEWKNQPQTLTVSFNTDVLKANFAKALVNEIRDHL